MLVKHKYVSITDKDLNKNRNNITDSYTVYQNLCLLVEKYVFLTKYIKFHGSRKLLKKLPKTYFTDTAKISDYI